MAHYYCLLFDADGTILDFEAAEEGAFRETLAHFSLPNTDEILQKYKQINTELWNALEQGKIRQEKLVVQRFEQLLDAIGAHGDPVKINQHYLSQLALHAEKFEGAEDAIRELAEVATLAIVSNGVERVQNGRLESSGLRVYFDDVFISGRVGASKPARKIFDTAIRTLGIENRKKVLMIGDSLKADIAGGINAGIDTCWCNFKDEPLAPEGPQPTYIVHNYEELLQIVMEEGELANVGNKEKRHQL